MTNRAIEALRADRDALVEIIEGLGDPQWDAPSGCDGWTVHDLIAHLGALFWVVVDPSRLPDTSGLPTEKAQEVYVDARRSWTVDQLVGEYHSVSEQALAALTGLEDQDFELSLGDLGTYRASVLPNAYTFDHYIHIRGDLFAPRGPLTTSPPADDELRLVPTLDWIEAALEQQNVPAITSLRGSIEISVIGLAARELRVGTGATVAHITSSAPALVRWVTQRATWADLGVRVKGDEHTLEIARTLHVF